MSRSCHPPRFAYINLGKGFCKSLPPCGFDQGLLMVSRVVGGLSLLLGGVVGGPPVAGSLRFGWVA